MVRKIEKTLSRLEEAFGLKLRKAVANAIASDDQSIVQNDVFRILRLQLNINPKWVPELLEEAMRILQMREKSGLPIAPSDAEFYVACCKKYADYDDHNRPGPRQLLTILQRQLSNDA